MSLKPCPNCRKPISDKAVKCPKCGLCLIPKSEDNSKLTDFISSESTTLKEPVNTKKQRSKNWIFVTGCIVLIGFIVTILIVKHNAYKEAQKLELARIEQLKQDSIIATQIEADRQLRRDSIFRNFHSPDLTLFNLKAPVKTLKTNDDKYLYGLLEGEKIEFDKIGFWVNYKDIIVSYSNNCKIISIERDNKGFINKINFEEGVGDLYYYSFKWEDDKIVSYFIYGYEMDVEAIINYKNDLLKTIEEKERGIEYEFFDNLNFSDYQLDKWGNWIECKQDSKSWTVFEEHDWDSYNEGWIDYKRKSDIKKESKILKQIISYYDMDY